MDTVLNFRTIPFKQDNASVLERTKIRELLEYERYCRDYNLFNEAVSCYTEDAQIHVSWFHGSAKEYWERTASAKGGGSKHKIFSTAIFLNGEKAVAEMQVMMLSPRMIIDGCAVDLVSYARIFSRLIKRDGIWKILYGDCIYERDELLPATPGNRLPILPDAIRDYRESYRNLS